MICLQEDSGTGVQVVFVSRDASLSVLEHFVSARDLNVRVSPGANVYGPVGIPLDLQSVLVRLSFFQ